VTDRFFAALTPRHHPAVIPRATVTLVRNAVIPAKARIRSTFNREVTDMIIGENNQPPREGAG